MTNRIPIQSLCFALGVLITPFAAHAEDTWPWEGASFAWNGQAALKSLPTLPKRERSKPPDPKREKTAEEEDEDDDAFGIDRLLHETRITVDAAGRETRVDHDVYWILTPGGARRNDSISAVWRKWHQDRPVIRARVISPDGSEHMLDPSTITTASTDSDDGDSMYTDDLQLTAPLPAIDAGVLVETETVAKDTSPFFGTAVFEQQYFPREDYAARRSRFTVKVPTSLPLKHKVKGEGLKVRTAEAGGFRTLEAEIGVVLWTDADRYDMDAVARIQVSTGDSWKTLATDYTKLVEAQLAKSDLRATAKEWAGSATGREAITRKLVASLHKTLRYTGLELGASSITPVTPKEALKRKYGDCKDLSTLLVGLLRAKNIPAEVVLLRAMHEQDVEPELPGLGQFNHAIVHVPGTPELWIDPTDPTSPVGELPDPDEDRQVLLATKATTGLVRTPASGMDANRMTVTREVRLAVRGWGRIVETTEATGRVARQMRATIRASTQKQARQQIETYAKRAYNAKTIGRIEFMPPDVTEGPYRSVIEIESTPVALTAETEAFIGLSTGELFEHLPWQLRRGDDDSDEDSAAKKKPQKEISIEPGIYESRYRIIPSSGLKLRPLPNQQPVDLGPLKFTADVKEDEGEDRTLILRLEIPVRKIQPAQAEIIRKAMKDLLRRNYSLTFDRSAWLLAKDGKYRAAADELASYAAAQPKEGAWHALLSRIWLTAGAGQESVREAKRAVELDPSSAYNWHTLAIAQMRDFLGRAFKPGYDRDGAITSIREAIKRDGKNSEFHALLTTLLMRSADGKEFADGARIEEALDEVKLIRKEFHLRGADYDYARCLFKLGRYQTIVDAEKTLESTPGVRAHILAAYLVTKGIDAMMQTARRLEPDEKQRDSQLGPVLGILMDNKLYKEMLPVLDHMPETEENRVAVSVFRAFASPRKETTVVKNDPVSVALVTVENLFAHPEEPQRLKDLVTARFAESYDGRHFRDALREFTSDKPEEVEPLALAYLSHASAKVMSKSDAGTVVRISPDERDRDHTFEAMLVPDGSNWRVAALTDTPDLAADEALAQLNAGHTNVARQWLRWAVETGDLQSVLKGFHTNDPSSASEAELRTIAAHFMLHGKLMKQAIPVVESLMRPGALRLEQQRSLAKDAASRLSLDSQYDRAWAILSPVVPANQVPQEVFSLANRLLRQLHRFEEAERMTATKLQEAPGDEQALMALMWTAAAQGKPDVAAQRGREALEKVNSADSTRMLENEIAWYDLAAGKANKATYELADTTVKRSPRPEAIHTLAAVAAVTGSLNESRDALLKLVSPKKTLDAHDWYVVGLLYEAYGLKADAIEAYAKVGRKEIEDPTGTAVLTLARLKGLGSPVADLK